VQAGGGAQAATTELVGSKRQCFGRGTLGAGGKIAWPHRRQRKCGATATTDDNDPAQRKDR
jgi:hypothetical protein